MFRSCTATMRPYCLRSPSVRSITRPRCPLVSLTANRLSPLQPVYRSTRERRDFFREASEKIAVALGPVTDPRVAQRATEGRNALLLYFEEIIPKRRAD